MCCSEREKATREGEEEEREPGQLRSVLLQEPRAHPFVLGSFLIRRDKGRAPQVIDALSVSLPMFCRSGASQEEPKAGGEYYDLQLSCMCAFPHACS